MRRRARLAEAAAQMRVVFVIVGAVGEESGKGFLDEGAGSGEAGADYCHVAFDCGPARRAGVVV